MVLLSKFGKILGISFIAFALTSCSSIAIRTVIEIPNEFSALEIERFVEITSRLSPPDDVQCEFEDRKSAILTRCQFANGDLIRISLKSQILDEIGAILTIRQLAGVTWPIVNSRNFEKHIPSENYSYVEVYYYEIYAKNGQINATRFIDSMNFEKQLPVQ